MLAINWAVKLKKQMNRKQKKKRIRGKQAAQDYMASCMGFPMRGSLRLSVRDSEEEQALVSAQRIFALRLQSRDVPVLS